MKKVLTAAGFALASSVVAVPAMAQVDASVGIASEYVFRGIESGSPQVWGGLDYSHASGLYAGTWISNAADGDEEVDLYGGYGFSLTEGMDLDVGAIYYMFPSTETAVQANSTEAYVGLNAGGFSGYAWYGFGLEGAEDDEYVYYEANYEIALTNGASLGAHVGINVPDEGDDSVDYGLTLGFGDFWIAATLLDTDNSNTDNPSINVGYSWTFENVVK